MPRTFTDANFREEVLQSPVPVLVDFWAPWCGPCRMVGPVIEEVHKAVDGKTARVGKVNVDENPQTAQNYGIMSIPTIMIFKNGQPVDQMIGVQTKEFLMEKLKNAAE